MAPCPVPTSHRPDILAGLPSCAEGGARRHARSDRWVCGSRSDRRRAISPRLVEVLIFLIRRGLIAFGATDARLCRSRPLAVAIPSADELGSASPARCRTTRRSRVATRFADSAGAFVCGAGVAVARTLLSNSDFRRRRASPRAHVNLERRLRADGCADRRQLVFHTMNYVRPYWTRSRSVGRILFRLGTLLLWLTLLNADTWVAANGGSTTTVLPSLEQIVDLVNISCRIALIVREHRKRQRYRPRDPPDQIPPQGGTACHEGPAKKQRADGPARKISAGGPSVRASSSAR